MLPLDSQTGMAPSGTLPEQVSCTPPEQPPIDRREKRLAYMRQYWYDNKERLQANQKKWREANKDRTKATNRAYYLTMKEGRKLLLSLPPTPPPVAT